VVRGIIEAAMTILGRGCDKRKGCRQFGGERKPRSNETETTLGCNSNMAPMTVGKEKQDSLLEVDSVGQVLRG
jgi:hypothetical protein